MPSVKLTYFDFHGGRGEDCRLALHIAGVDFHDNRINPRDWSGLKPNTPFGSLPVLAIDGQELGQSNAILGFIGRQHGLHPADPWEAARHEALLACAEDLRNILQPTLSLKDPDEKRAKREALAQSKIPVWADRVEAQITAAPFLAGEKISVADLKLFVVLRWIIGGTLDHIPATAFDGHPKLRALYDAVAAHPGVKSWYAQ